MAKITAIATITADGSTDGFEYKGGDGQLIFRGTWDSASIAIETCETNTAANFVPYRDNAALTANGAVALDIPSCFLRFTTSSAGGTADIDIILITNI